MDNCIFCKIIAGEIPAIKVYESDNVLAFMDINPMEKGHLLVIPKIHFNDLAALKLETEKEVECYEETMYIVHVAVKAVKDLFADGANVLQTNGECAGQTVSHIHFHVIPRYNGNTLKWESGAYKYEDGECKALAEKIGLQISQIIKDEDLI